MYRNKKSDAKRRRKPFTITLEYFRTFAIETGYDEKRGRKKYDLTIDCIKPKLGYVPGNLRLLTNSENASKGNREIDEPF